MLLDLLAFKNRKLSDAVGELRVRMSEIDKSPSARTMITNPLYTSPRSVSPLRKSSAENPDKLSESDTEELLEFDRMTRMEKVMTMVRAGKLLDEISELHTLALCAYSHETRSTKYPSWKFLCDTTSIHNTAGYYGQAWVDEEKKQIVIASAGTKLTFIGCHSKGFSNLFGLLSLAQDVASDLQIFNRIVPFQYEWGVKQFVDYLIRTYNCNGYNLVCVGHSLGAATSSAAALYAHRYSEIFSSIGSVTMENPGSKYLMERISQKMKRDGYLYKDFDLASIQDQFIVINNAPNFINTANPQFGTIFRNSVANYKEIPAIVSKYLPRVFTEMIETALSHLDFHDNGYFFGMNTITHEEEWPVGMFTDYCTSKASTVAAAISSVIHRSQTLSYLCSAVVKTFDTIASTPMTLSSLILPMVYIPSAIEILEDEYLPDAEFASAPSCMRIEEPD